MAQAHSLFHYFLEGLAEDTLRAIVTGLVLPLLSLLHLRLRLVRLLLRHADLGGLSIDCLVFLLLFCCFGCKREIIVHLIDITILHSCGLRLKWRLFFMAILHLLELLAEFCMFCKNLERSDRLLTAHVVQDQNQGRGEVLIDLLLDLVRHRFITLIRLDKVICLLKRGHHMAVQLIVPANLHRRHSFLSCSILFP